MLAKMKRKKSINVVVIEMLTAVNDFEIDRITEIII